MAGKSDYWVDEMIKRMGDDLKLTPSETVTVRESGPDGLVVEATYGGGGSPPPKHFHPAQDEHFEVLEGSLRAEVDGVGRDLPAGETLEVPRGAVHQMWNPGASPARVLWRTSPAGRTEQWFRAVDGLNRRAEAAGRKGAGTLDFAPLLTEFDDVIRLAGPQPVLRPALRGMALVSRLARRGS